MSTQEYVVEVPPPGPGCTAEGPAPGARRHARATQAWNVGTLLGATMVSYLRPGVRRGSLKRGIIPGEVRCSDAAALDLELLLGRVEDVGIIEMLYPPDAIAVDK